VLHGRYTSAWSYGRLADATHDALRQRVVVETAAEGDVLVVRLRVQQESSETASHVGDPRADDWQPYADDELQAQTSMTRLAILLRDLATPVADPTAKPAEKPVQ
jgi:hypothetical protein